MNIPVQIFVWTQVFPFLGICLGAELLGRMIILCLPSKGTVFQSGSTNLHSPYTYYQHHCV